MTEAGESPDTVAVPRWLLWTLVAGLGASSLAAAYLMGRQSVDQTVLVAGSSVAPAVAAGPPDGPDPAPPKPAVSPTPPTTSVTTATTTAVTPDSRQPANARPIRDYLTAMDAAVALGRTGMQPDAMAQAIIQDAMAGRTDGFDQLIASNRAVLAQVDRVTAPQSCDACQQHRSQTQAVLKESLALLTDLRNATAMGDLQALAGAQGRATSLENKAREIEALKQRIVESAGLR